MVRRAPSLQIRIKNELLALNLLVIVLITAIIFFSSDVLRVILGLSFVLFFPGYTLMAVLSPSRERIGGIERVALSFGMSIVVIPLIGLVLNYTSWGITLESVLYSVASFIFLMSVITWFRRKRFAKEERFSIGFHLSLPRWGTGIWDKTLSIILIISVLGALGMLGYVLVKPNVGERFTEFYILGTTGRTTDYPTELKLGEEAKVTIGIINQEHETVSYHLEVRINGLKNNEVGPIILEQEERWEGEVSFVLNVSGDNQGVEFLLYKDDQVEPSLGPLHLWVDITE